MRVPTIVLAFLMTAAPAAAGCLEDVRELATEHRLSTDPPTVTPGNPPGGSRTDELARSKGVIEPPRMSDRSVIAPPAGVDPGMKTLPDLVPNAQDRAAVDRIALQALLTAARAQAERGEEARCREQLDEARRLLGRSTL